jgi:hypothetical protein
MKVDSSSSSTEAMTTDQVVQKFVDAFPELRAPIDEMAQEWHVQSFDDENAPGLYSISSQVLMPRIVKPLLRAMNPDPGRLTAFFVLVEALLATADSDVETFVKVELCPELRYSQAPAVDSEIGTLTRGLCGEIGRQRERPPT